MDPDVAPGTLARRSPAWQSLVQSTTVTVTGATPVFIMPSLMPCRLRHIDDTPLHEWAAIIDGDHDTFAIGSVRHPDPCTAAMAAMGGCHGHRIHLLPAGGTVSWQ